MKISQTLTKGNYKLNRQYIFTSLLQGIKLLRKKAILSLGITDSLYQCSIQILVFIWTPVLQITAGSKNINPGMIYILMLISFLIQNKCLEFFNMRFKLNYFIFSNVYILIYIVEYFFVYYIDSFPIRLVLISFINVSHFKIGIWRYLPSYTFMH